MLAAKVTDSSQHDMLLLLAAEAAWQVHAVLLLQPHSGTEDLLSSCGLVSTATQLQ